MTCETRCHKKLGFHHLFRRYIFGKTIRGGDQIDPPAFLGLVNRTCGNITKCVILMTEIPQMEIHLSYD